MTVRFRVSRCFLTLGSPIALFALACQPPAAQSPDATVHVAQAADVVASADDDPPAAASAEDDAAWWSQAYPDRFETAAPYTLPFISVKGNRFIDEQGKTFVFQGVNVADPDKLQREGQLKRELFEAIKGWGANVVRIPVHPAAWRGVGKPGYFELLDQVVNWATELELYLIIDWHSIGNLVTELYQHPMYETTRQETFEFWRSIAFRYQGVPTIALYELFNEPTRYGEKLGRASWEQWKELNEEMITIIYSHDDQVIPLVAGFDWAYDLRDVRQAPVEKTGIGYVSHPYPQKVQKPFEKKWDETFGFVAEEYPLITTEIGYMPPDGPGAHNPVRDDGTYGKLITDYLADKGASWTAWCFDPDWSPQLIEDWTYAPTEAGAHFRSVMLETRGKSKGEGAAQK